MDLHGIPHVRGRPVRTDWRADYYPTLGSFLALCVAEVAVGAKLWTGASYAPAVSYGLLPFELTFWIGFALPLGPVLAVARVALLLA